MTMIHTGHGAAAKPDAPGGGPTYTCPMHAEITRPEPGKCPICGMTLVPMSAAQDRPR